MYHRIRTKRRGTGAPVGPVAALLALSTGLTVAATTILVTPLDYADAASTTFKVDSPTLGLSTLSGTATWSTGSRVVAARPPRPNVFRVSRAGSSRYRAVGRNVSFRGSLERVVERAVAEISASGSAGTVRFTAGDFNLGAGYFGLRDIHNITFAGAGMNSTVIRNKSRRAKDTEPFSFYGAFGVTIKNMTINAGGSPRTTSDAIDFDRGNNSIVENVKVTRSRGHGIMFDGKNFDWESRNNTVRNCVITGVHLDGIEFLASSDNTVEGCRIRNVGGHGIEIAKASAVAPGQPNKKSNGNLVRKNVIDRAGQDGIRIHGGDNNVIRGNTVTNSADAVANHDGIRIASSDGVSCNRNRVVNNVATDHRPTKTQRYGLNISTPLCHHTVLSSNRLKGNRVARIHDEGTGTQRR